MIMSLRSAKNPNWAGAVVLGCLGLALLPVPVRAQQPTPDNVVPIQVQPGKETPMSVDEQIEALRGVLQLPQLAAPFNSTQREQIETLRRVVQQLEEQKRKEQGQAAPSKPADPASPWPANWKEINKAIEQVNRLTRDVEEQRKEMNKEIDKVNRLMRAAEDKRKALREAESRLRQAHEEVEKLQGKSAGSRVLPSNVVPVNPR